MKQKKKRILYVITKSNFGGAQRYVYELATNLEKEKFEVAVAFGGSGILKTKLEEADIKTYEIKSFERDINLAKEIQAMQELRSIISTFDPHILHLNSSKAGGSGAFIGRLAGIPKIIFTAHGWPFYEKRNVIWRALVWFFSYLTVLFSHKTIVVSRHDFKKHIMPLISYKIVQINTAVPKIHFKEKTESRLELFSEEIRLAHENDLWVVSTGEFTQNKNLLPLLKAVSNHNKSENKKIFLSLIGDGEDREKLQSYVHANNLSDQVSFLGFVENARLYLKAFDVFVIPSLKEGLPYGLLEAGAAGLYCVASNVGGIPDVIENGINGTLIHPEDTKELVSALEHIPIDVEQVGARLKARIEKDFSLSQMIEKTERLY